MSRKITRRWVLTGDLVAESEVHVRGLDDGPYSLTHAQDGLGRPVLPGTSLAGVIRATLGSANEAEEPLWGISDLDATGHDNGAGQAARVSVYDAPAPATTIAEAREHVSIERIHGVASRGHLFTRETLPVGTRFAFRMVIDDEDGGSGNLLILRIAALLRGPGINVGAASTKGLGHVRLYDAKLRGPDFATRAGMIAALRNQVGDEVLPTEDRAILNPGILRVTIPWRPRGPLSVQVSVDGDVVDAFPLTVSIAGTPHLAIPGDTIKGVLRTHAERIMRTLNETPTQTDFLPQLTAVGLGPVAAIFGTAARQRSDDQQTGRRGALRVNTCLSVAGLPNDEWSAVRLLQRAMPDKKQPEGADRELAPDADTHQDDLAALQTAVDTLNEKITGIRFVIAPHVAIDRWTGGAAELFLLFATLEPHTTDNDAWRPVILELDVRRLRATTGGNSAEDQATSLTALALLLLVLRDLCQGLIAFGHGTTRGMGAVVADPTSVRFEAGPETDWLAELHNRTLAGDLRRQRTHTATHRSVGATGRQIRIRQLGGRTMTNPPQHRIHEDLGMLRVEQALATFAESCGGDAIGFCYRPQDARWFRLDPTGAPHGPQQRPLNLTGVFELRAFTATRELRWHHVCAGEGRSLVVSDRGSSLDTDATGPWLHDPEPYGRLLWGSTTAPAEDGWVSLFSARIGTLAVPVDWSSSQRARVWLHACEYVDHDQYGNATVVDERLIGLTVRAESSRYAAADQHSRAGV